MPKAAHSRTTTPTSRRVLLKYRRLWERVWQIEAKMAALKSPGKLTPAMARLEAKLERACAETTAAAEAIWRKPVRSLSDLQARLEVAQAECIEQDVLDEQYLSDRATLELISAVRTLLGSSPLKQGFA